MIYVIGGDDGTSNLSSVEMYNPKVKETKNFSLISHSDLNLLTSDGHMERFGCKHDDRKKLHWCGSDRQTQLFMS